MKILEGHHYSKDHEWIKVEGNLARIGITDHAQDNLGDVVYVELPETGSEYQSGDAFGVVESVKAASDLYTPITGKIVDINEELLDNPEKINEDPYGSWMVVVEISNEDELNKLMSPQEDQIWCAKED